MTLDEAIKHCKEKAEELRERVDVFDGITSEADVTQCLECANEHEQLAEWLKDYRRLLGERPQGEWIDYSEEGFVECPFCHKATTCEDNIDELHYCWNCGAKMKGGAE